VHVNAWTPIGHTGPIRRASRGASNAEARAFEQQRRGRTHGTVDFLRATFSGGTATFDGTLIKMVSDAPASANHTTPECSPTGPTFYRDDLDQLHAVRWFEVADPLDQRNIHATQTAARDEFLAET
jgi:hypothetical protein